MSVEVSLTAAAPGLIAIALAVGGWIVAKVGHSRLRSHRRINTDRSVGDDLEPDFFDRGHMNEPSGAEDEFYARLKRAIIADQAYWQSEGIVGSETPAARYKPRSRT